MSDPRFASAADLDIERLNAAVASLGATVEETSRAIHEALRPVLDLLTALPDTELEARQRSLADLNSKRIPVRHINAGVRQPVSIKRHTGQPGKRMQR